MRNQPREILLADLWWLEQRRSFQGQVREDGRHVFLSACVPTQNVVVQIPLVAAVLYPGYQLAVTSLGLLLTASLGKRLLPWNQHLHEKYRVFLVVSPTFFQATLCFVSTVRIHYISIDIH